jgi:hypothetical protein
LQLVAEGASAGLGVADFALVVEEEEEMVETTLAPFDDISISELPLVFRG